jgi:RNA polymerase sigma factor (sigma-70 family)
MTRNKRVPTVPFDDVAHLLSESDDPFLLAERSELHDRVFAAIQTLPEQERIATTLFYINEFSRKEIAAFLEVLITTVKKRLYTARQQLRRRVHPRILSSE